jgi:hypothetical protein
MNSDIDKIEFGHTTSTYVSFFAKLKDDSVINIIMSTKDWSKGFEISNSKITFKAVA